MENKQKLQAGQIVPVQLTLTLEAFYKALTTVLGTGKVGWGGEEQTALLNTLLHELKAADGNSAEFTEEQENVLQLTVRQSEDLQRTVFRQTLATAGYQLDPNSENLIAMLFGPAQFAKFLSDTENPATGKPFIDQPKKKGAKKKAFAALVKVIPAARPALAPVTETPKVSIPDTGNAPATSEQTETATK